MEDKIDTKDVNKFIDKCVCPECGFSDELGIENASCDLKKCRQCGAMMMTSLQQQNEELIKSLKKEDTLEGKFRILVEGTAELEADSDEKDKDGNLITSKDKDEKKKKKKGEKDEKDEKGEKDDSEDETNEGRLFNRLDEGDDLNKKVDHKSKYHCEKCGIVVSASIYEDETVCPKCGDDFAILEDKTFLDNERRFICPQCSTSYKYTKINEDSCAFCQSLMTVFDKPEIRKSKTAISTE